ncbi:cation diffusion facilitator family transporter [Acidocella facilis]|uniref:cation diffusion facilitator family transporter n=1 Tax=Acidocella facilis TaxID=525 RepID=UPI00047DFBC0|nr:cation diffusion facilitator family transporter [Acidocella facilis]
MSTTDPTDATLRKAASGASLAFAVVLVVVKFAAWIATGSMSLLTSAVDALVDVGASLATFYGVRYAQRPADADHRYGHGKGEAIAAFTQAMLLAGAAMVLAFQSIERLVFPERLEALDFGIMIIALSLLAAIVLVVMQSWVVGRTGSTAIAADRAHYLTDVAVNAAVLAALALTHFTGWTRADPAFALLIALYMMWNARFVANEALSQLLDRELTETDRMMIRRTALGCRGVEDIHDLRTRHAGDRVFVEFHLEVEGRLSVNEGHAIGDAVERAVRRALPGRVEVSVHLEPAGIEDHRLDDQVETKG